MQQTVKNNLLKFSFSILILMIFLSSLCSCAEKDTKDKSTSAPISQKLCKMIDLGEASDLIEKKDIPDNQYCKIGGISDPRILMWQDMTTSKIYFATKVMGAQGRLFYMQELNPGEKPALKEGFEGTITKWSSIDKTLSQSMAEQFKNKWDVTITPADTYIIMGNKKPDGCSK
ncbi:MAG: hypothetical protein JXR91_06250 [Deltaproteobacteria bacterium]|nr:hypothetical protein [Deltaproteobacteria bacterium]